MRVVKGPLCVLYKCCFCMYVCISGEEEEEDGEDGEEEDDDLLTSSVWSSLLWFAAPHACVCVCPCVALVLMCARVCMFANVSLRTGGVGFPEISPKKVAALCARRVEVLRLFLIILSESLYVEPNPAAPVSVCLCVHCHLS